MAYPDPNFNVRPLIPVMGLATFTAVGTGTALASALTTVVFPTYIKASQVQNVQVAVVTAPNGAATGEVINFLNGTNTFAVATIGTLTAGQVVTAAGNTNGSFAAGGIATATAVCTATSAGAAGGVFAIWFETRELYS